jgi:hypothetical protein
MKSDLNPYLKNIEKLTVCNNVPFLLRCVQIGLSLSELDLLTIGVVNDMFTEKENDEYDGWHEVAGQADFDSF